MRFAEIAVGARDVCSHGTSSLGCGSVVEVCKASTSYPKGQDVVTPLGWFMEFECRCEAAVMAGSAG